MSDAYQHHVSAARKQRYHDDPEYRERRKSYNLAWHNQRFANDPAYRESIREQKREYMQRRKQA